MTQTEINTTDIAVMAIQDAMLAIIAKQHDQTATEDDLYNLAVFTHCIQHLKF